jgi:hypothetical protein
MSRFTFILLCVSCFSPVPGGTGGGTAAGGGSGGGGGGSAFDAGVPFIVADVATVAFAEGTLIGTTRIDTLALTNEGLRELDITDVEETGDAAFTFKLVGPLPLKVQGKQMTFIQVSFTPTAPRKYSGTLTVTSNADNAPSLAIGLSGCGVSTLDAGC